MLFMGDPFVRLQSSLPDRYRLERELGAGGMATVYLALDTKHQRQVAIKVLRPELAAALGPDRFLREIEISAKLRHPHILPLFDSGTAGDYLYYVMPFVAGESLRDRLTREKQLPIEEAVRITREIADALSYAHGQDVLHRDIKPENILLESGHAVVADFGIARAISAAGGDRLTGTGISIGTPAYMSPEQAAGDQGLDGRTDLYSLGTVLYEMLAGSPPFTGATVQAVLARKAVDPPPPLRSVRDILAPSLERVVLTALARAPADRFPTVERFAEALARPEATSPARARPVRFGAIALAVILALGLGGVWLLSRPDDQAAPAYTILAEVDGSAPPEIRRAVERLLRAALDQGSVLVPLDEDELQEGLRRMLRADSLPLDGPTARELAYRASLGSAVVPSLEQVGRTFALTVRVVHPETGKLLGTAQATADTEDGLIPAVDQAARAIQRRLGARRTELDSARNLPEVTTASFDAYRKFAASSGLPPTQRRTMLREALTLDSSFAAAWDALAVTWLNVGQNDSLAAAVSHLERLLDRGGERERLGYRASIASARRDFEALLDITERQIREYGAIPGWLNTRGLALFAMGRAEEAAQSTRQAIAISRYGPSRGHVNNLFQWLVALGQPAEGWKVVDSIRTACGSPCEGYLAEPGPRVAIVLDEWGLADSLAALTRDRFTRASVLARRGELRAAEAELDRYGPDEGTMPELARLLLIQVRGLPWSRPLAVVAHDALHTVAWNGIWDAMAGDTGGARRIASALRDSLPGRYRGAMPEFIEAAVAARGGDWRQVVDGLGPVAAGAETGRANLDLWIHGLPARWLVATAYERLGMLDSAAVMYERVLWPGGALLNSLSLRGIPYSFAHQRLVVIHAQLGRLEDANRHYKLFSEAFTKPDPDLRYLVDQARAALRR